MSQEAHAIWKGGLFTGEGNISTPSGVLNNSTYAYGSFAGDVHGTTPCEMLAAAIASCMATTVAVEMAKVGIKPATVDTYTSLTFDNPADQGQVTGVRLNITARTTDVEPRGFEAAIEAALHSCPVTNLLKVELKCKSKLTSVTAVAMV